MTEAICLVFDVVPSELRKLYWKYTLNDIKVRLKLYLGREQALILQSYDTMALLINQAFGGTSTKEASPPKEQAAGTLAEMTKSFAGMF